MAQAIDELDLGGLGRALWRRKGWILGLTLLAAGLAFVVVNLMTPFYKSEARVLIETRENIFLRPDAEKVTMERGTTVDQEAVTSQVQLILSRDLAREVIKKLKLNEKPEFDPVLRGSSMVKVLLGLVGLAKDPMSQTPEERVLKSFSDRLSAFQVEKSRVIAIEFESEDPELAALVANTIAETYLVFQQAVKQDQTRAASQFLAGEIDKLRKAVNDAEAKADQYRSRSNLMIGTNNTTLSNQQLGEFNALLGTARAQKADAEGKARIIRDALRTGGPIEFSDIINSELMRRLSEQRVTLRAQLAEQSSTLLDQHPRIKELKAQIAGLEQQLRTEADRLARSLENDAKFATAKVESLTTSLDQMKRQAATTNEQDVELRALEREAKAQRDLLESYLAKYREATARDSVGAASPEARIISSAIVSNTPSWPKKVPTVLIAGLGMLALSIGFVLSGELLSAPASARPAVVAEVQREPVVIEPAATAPAAAPAAVAAVGDVPEHGVPLAAIEALARELAAAKEKRVGVLGASHNLDTSLVAITLARTLGNTAKVVLVDLVFGGTGVSVVSADPSAPGIGELVHGTASFGQIITRDRYSRVHVITAGKAESDEAAIIGSQRLAVTLEALARSYDHVIVHAGAAPDADAERIAQLAPQAVLVTDPLDEQATARARAQLATAGFEAVSVLHSIPAAPQADASRAAA
jgi:uncharacterized protein involved in exopolysaccharide biosynthesis